MLRIKRPFVLSSLSLIFSYAVMMLDTDIVLHTAIVIFSALFLISAAGKTAIAKVLLIIVLSFTSAALCFQFSEAVREKENLLTGYGKEISGTVTDIVFDENGCIHSVMLSDCTADNTEIYSKITLYPGDNAQFSLGDSLCFTATELYTAENDGIFAFHSLSDRCHLSCYNKSDEYIVTERENNLYISILKIRNYAYIRLKSALNGDSFAVALALLTGSKDAVSPELSSAFGICGISHIFAVSGMHLSLWTGFFFIIFKRKAKVSFIPNILSSLFVIFYIVFTGFSPSVLRAGIMLLTVFSGRLIKRASDPLNSLGLSGTVLMLFNPYLAGNVSFLLSFTATGAIALWSEYILPEKKENGGKLRLVKRKLKKPFYDVIISSAVILTTLPIASLFFGYFSLISPFASLIITPLAQGVMLLSAFLVLLPQETNLYGIFQFLTDTLCSEITDTVLKFSRADFLLVPAELSLLLPCFVITSAFCAFFIIFLKDRRKALTSIIAGTLIFSLLTMANIYIHKDETEIVVFGKENATLIAVTDNSYSAVIGSGGSFSLISELTRHLQKKAIVRADLLFIPRSTETENQNTEYLKNHLFPGNTVLCSPKNSPASTELWDNNRITGFTDESFSAAALYIDGVKIIICTLPSSEFGENREEFISGDILICRSNIPESLDTSAFSDVIIITDIKRDYPFPCITTENSNIKITVKGDSYAIC